eukprot:s7523_g1.t1
MCITVPVEERDKKFIMDSGSGHDLISIKKIDRMDLSTYDDEVVNFHTANGVTSSTKRSDIDFKAFGEPAQMHVLDDTPSVLSMGKRCLDLGYSFVWPVGKNPYMIDGNGDIIEMTVKDYIPYVNLDQEKKVGNKKKVEKILEIISDECSTSEGENMLVIDGFRRISGTPRPSRYTPTEWQKMAPDVRKGIAKAEEKKAEAELERKTSEARIKESEDRKKAKEKKKVEREEKRSSGSGKKKDDHPASVAKSQDHICRGKVFQYGRKHPTSIGSGASVMSDSSDTDVPADDDFIVEWDEWS